MVRKNSAHPRSNAQPAGHKSPRPALAAGVRHRQPRPATQGSSVTSFEPGQVIPIHECPVYLVAEEDGGFSASVATLPGCHSQGDSEEEALRNIIEALEGVLEAYHAREMPVPWRKPARRPAGALIRTVIVHA